MTELENAKLKRRKEILSELSELKGRHTAASRLMDYVQTELDDIKATADKLSEEHETLA